MIIKAISKAVSRHGFASTTLSRAIIGLTLQTTPFQPFSSTIDKKEKVEEDMYFRKEDKKKIEDNKAKEVGGKLMFNVEMSCQHERNECFKYIVDQNLIKVREEWEELLNVVKDEDRLD
jgi:hypothetical protein